MRTKAFWIHAKAAFRILVACAAIGLGTLNVGCLGTFFLDRADTPSGNPNAGDYHLAGVIQDAWGRPINGVSLTIISTVCYYRGGNDYEVPPFYTGVEKEVQTANGEFSVEVGNAVGVTLLFEKGGFASVRTDFATDNELGAPVIHNHIRIILRNANPSTHQGEN
jgi:hypothetical protein